MTSLAAKIDLVMKALTLSRGRLAAELAVNKSMVSRWLSGTVIPSSHNLSQLTLLVAQRVPGFTLLDWDRDLPALADRLGAGVAPPAQAPTPAAPPAEDAMPAFRSMTGARREIARHGAAYEGIWQGVRPACTQPGVVLKEHILIQKVGADLRIVWGGAGWRCEGWLMPILGQLYGMMSDDADDSVQFCILNGNRMPRVDTIDGLTLTNAKDTTDTPTAEPCLLERVADLSGDPEADEARYEALRQRYATTTEISDEVRAHLFPDSGPAAVAAGIGDLLLRLPLPRSKSKGTPAGGWS